MAAQQRKVIAAGMIWNALEWYDFALYGYFAVAIGRHRRQETGPRATSSPTRRSFRTAHKSSI
jgi:hypothetical protein